MPRPRPWTDDELREAVSISSSLNEVCRRLGLVAGGQTYESVRRGITRLGLTLLAEGPHATQSSHRRGWTDEQLREAVRVSSSLRQVCEHLGLAPGSRRNENLRRHIARLGLDDAHLPRTEAPIRTSRSWTEDDLREAIRLSCSIAEVQRRLGFTPSGGMHRYVTAQIRARGLDTSHFLGRSWSRGRSHPQGRRIRPLTEILVTGSCYPSSKLRVRLIAAGIKTSRCEWCGIVEWRGRPIPLALDHINGDPTDNRLENLRILCPNCHAQTETWCRSKRTGAELA